MPPGQQPTLLYAIKQVELAIRAQLELTVQELGLTGTQYTALTVLARRPRLTSTELAKNSFVRAQTMSAVTAELEQRGLVSREQDPKHLRRQLLSVTPAALEILAELLPQVRKLEEQMVSGLSPVEIAQLRDALQFCRYDLGGSWPH